MTAIISVEFDTLGTTNINVQSPKVYETEINILTTFGFIYVNCALENSDTVV